MTVNRVVAAQSVDGVANGGTVMRIGAARQADIFPIWRVRLEAAEIVGGEIARCLARERQQRLPGVVLRIIELQDGVAAAVVDQTQEVDEWIADRGAREIVEIGHQGRKIDDVASGAYRKIGDGGRGAAENAVDVAYAAAHRIEIVEDVGVDAVPAGERIVAAGAEVVDIGEEVVAVPAGEAAVVHIGGKRIVAGVAQHRLIAVVVVERNRIVAVAAVHRVAAPGDEDDVVAGAAIDRFAA